MCQDEPGKTPRRRIAICSCNQDFPDCDLEDAKRHITENNKKVHRWVYATLEVRGWKVST